MNKLDKFLNDMKVKPILYIGENDIKLFKTIIDGFIDGYNKSTERKIFFYPGFEEFVKKKLKVEDNLNWAEAIEFVVENNEERIPMFYTLLHEFKSMQ